MKMLKFLFLSLFFVVVSCKKDDFAKELKESAATTNKLGPQILSDGVRLDNVSASDDNTFQYNYTLLEDEKEKVTPEEIEVFKTSAREEALKVIKTSDEMKMFRDHKVTLKYHYVDKNGKPLTDFTIAPTDYK